MDDKWLCVKPTSMSIIRLLQQKKKKREKIHDFPLADVNILNLDGKMPLPTVTYL